MIDMDIHVGNYVALRDKIKALDEAHEEHLKPFMHPQDSGLESLK